MLAATSDAGPPACAKTREAEVELVVRAREGDRLALAQIYREHRESVGRHIFMQTQDSSIVDDLVQDTFVIAFDRLDRFTGESLLRTWLHGIGLNVVRNHRRTRRRRTGLLARVLGGRKEDDPTAAADVSDRQQRAMLALRRGLDALDDDKREAFVLRVLEQVPLAEAADVLGVPIATISYRARRAEAMMRAHLEGLEAAS